MKLAVIGSRRFNDYDLLKKTITDLVRSDETIQIVSGGAKGADSLAERFATENNIERLIFMPDWKRHGKSAGLIRNKLIVDASDMVLAFWDGESVGTKHSVDYARKKSKKVVIVEFSNSKQQD